MKQVANYLGVKYLFDLAAQPGAGAGAASAPPTREEVDINGRVSFELTFHEASGAVRDEGSGRTTNYIPSIRPKTEVGPEISISPFLQFKEDGFVDFMFNGLFTQPVRRARVVCREPCVSCVVCRAVAHAKGMKKK